MDQLTTPNYDIETQSCLTHVYDVMRSGGIADVPLTSPPTLTTARYLGKLKKLSKLEGLTDG